MGYPPTAENFIQTRSQLVCVFLLIRR